MLPRKEQDTVRAKVAAIIASEPTLTGQNPIQFPYVTELYVFRKRG